MDPLDDIGRDVTEKDALVCKCGHTGFLVFRDRSKPYSPLLEFSLEGFTGTAITVTSYGYVPERLFAELNPTCPACGGVGTVGYPSRTPEEERKLIAQYNRRLRPPTKKGTKAPRPKKAAKKPKAKKSAVKKRGKAVKPKKRAKKTKGSKRATVAKRR